MRRFLASGLLALFAFTAAAHAADDGLLVFAAASLTESMNDVGKAYAAAGHAAPKFSYAASSALAHQIENGAPAALFMSADEDWMDYLATHQLIVADTRAALLGNTLVLVAPAAHPMDLKITHGFALAKALGGGKLAMADPDSVPAGKYGRAALQSLGVWDSVAPNVIRGDSVRGALAFIERDEAAAGIVYGSDAALTPKVKVVGVFPADSHPVISYPVALIAGHDSPAARAFLTFLRGPEAAAVFTRYGFSVNAKP